MSRAILGTLFVVAASRSPQAHSGRNAAAAHLQPPYGPAQYGSTQYGTWAPDFYNNPSYIFTGGPSSAPDSIYPSSPTILHAAGNDRVSAIIFSDGSASLRQDEGGAKLLHGGIASVPAAYQFRGAAGYLANATHVVSATVVDASCVALAR